MRRFLSFVRKEFYHIFRDWRTMLILLVYPVVLILLFGYAAGKLCQRLLTRNYISMLILTAFECVLLGLLRYLFSLMHAGASFLIVLRQLAVGTVLTCLFCFIVYLPLRRLSGKSRKRSR